MIDLVNMICTITGAAAAVLIGATLILIGIMEKVQV